VSEVASEVGAGQTVDEEVDAVVAEEDGTGDVHPATRPVHLSRVVRQLADGSTLEELDVVETPGDEERNVEKNKRGGDQNYLVDMGINPPWVQFCSGYMTIKVGFGFFSSFLHCSSSPVRLFQKESSSSVRSVRSSPFG